MMQTCAMFEKAGYYNYFGKLNRFFIIHKWYNFVQYVMFIFDDTFICRAQCLTVWPILSCPVMMYPVSSYCSWRCSCMSEICYKRGICKGSESAAVALWLCQWGNVCYLPSMCSDIMRRSMVAIDKNPVAFQATNKYIKKYDQNVWS